MACCDPDLPTPEESLVTAPVQKRFITESELLEDAFRLGVSIANSGFRPNTIVGLWRGGSTVGIYVQECLQTLGILTDHIAIRTSYRGLASYEQMIDNPEREIRIHGTQYLLETLKHDSGLLIVDDVYASGLTMEAVIKRLTKRLKRNTPHDIRTAAVWHKPARNRTGSRPDYHVHESEQWLVMPYELDGLSEDEISAHKPWLDPILASIKH